VNEGAGEVFEYGGQRTYGVCCAEKGVFRFTIETHGRAAHGSIPRLGDNALVKLAPLLERLADAQPGFDVVEQPAALLRALGLDPDDPAAAVAHFREREPALALLVEPMLGVTFAPTMAGASDKVNVIPSRAHVKVDCRVPPGLGEDVARARIAEVLGEDGYRIRFDEQVVGNGSPVESPLFDAIRDWIGEQDPEAQVVPIILPGFSDSRWWRHAFPDCVAYGFFPQFHQPLFEAAPLVHGADERIDVRDLGFAARFFTELPQRLLT
jgi:acetylornithine deacetylase/succinyl-diaminopimelate desuccinylase-like protein